MIVWFALQLFILEFYQNNKKDFKLKFMKQLIINPNFKIKFNQNIKIDKAIFLMKLIKFKKK